MYEKLESADFRDPECREVVTYRYGAETEATVHVRHALDAYGFAVAVAPEAETGEDALGFLAAQLGLGQPFVPDVYKGSGAPSRFADIVADDRSDHPAFANNNGQSFHVDGLLEPMGRVRTSMLHCLSAAAAGGRTIMFNSCAAWRRLSSEDAPAADELLRPDVLARRASLPGVDAEAVGPALDFDAEGVLRTRYSDGPTESWIPAAGREATLDRALTFMRAAGESDGQYRVSLSLAEGQTLVFANDRLSHGREAYEDSPDAPRHLVRALFTDGVSP